MKQIALFIVLTFFVLNTQAKKPIENKINIQKNISTKIKPMNWFTDAWDWVSSPFRPVWGKYTEGGSTNRYFPLASADRKIEVDSLRKNIKGKIKLGIEMDSGIFNIYTKIYDNAKKPLVNCSNLDNGVCENASIAKDAAFVYWLGIDELGDSLSPTSRHSFYVKAVTAFIFWTAPREIKNYFKGKGSQIYRAKENIMLMQAYNFLEMTKFESDTLFLNTHRENIRDEIFSFTYELYSNANNWLSGFQGGALTPFVSNNMTLIVATAIGMG